MSEGSPRVRLRQAVLLAPALEPLCGELARALELEEPFHDPGVAEFGLVNAVYALGDCFLEVIAPTREGTAAGRYLDRFGPGGYMALFDLEDLAGARERVGRLGVRIVWQIDLPDISGTHLHPGDMGGAIVSLDRSEPYGSWRWGGPRWTGRIGSGPPGALTGIVLAVPDPVATATRWAQVLGAELSGAGQPRLGLDGGAVGFRAPGPDGRSGLVEIELVRGDGRTPGARAIELGGVTLRFASGPGGD